MSVYWLVFFCYSVPTCAFPSLCLNSSKLVLEMLRLYLWQNNCLMSREHVVLMFSGSFTGFHIFFPFYRQCSVMHNFECLMVVTGMHSYLVLGHQFHKIFFSYCQRKLSNSKWLGPMGMTYLILRWWPKFPSKRSVKAFNHSAHLWSLQNKGAFHLTWSNMIKTVWQIYALRHVVPADVNT